jgi:acyl-CoA reductase-like NAD-dependent aldehyde dehydrogenase
MWGVMRKRVHVDNRMRIAREEIFGPVASILHFGSEAEAEAEAIANDSPTDCRRGSGASTCTARTVSRALRASAVHVNRYDDNDITVPLRRCQTKPVTWAGSAAERSGSRAAASCRP